MAGGEMNRMTSMNDEVLTSFELPTSPCLSPTGSDNISVWVETSGGEQHVHLALADATIMEPPVSPTAATTSVHHPSEAPAEPMEFPLVLCQDAASTTHSYASSALVPFQKLQMDTNLHQTLLPYENPSSPSYKLKKHGEETSMSTEFMHALRLGDFPGASEPQLSVRLRGRRVELASSSDGNDQQVDFLGPAENIKKLFKLPYSQSRVSLAVHRVGSTLVVDWELEDQDIPMGFEDLPRETLKIEPESDAMKQNLLYEKFIYQSMMGGRLATAQDEKQTDKMPVETTTTSSSTKTIKKQTKKSKKSKKHNQTKNDRLLQSTVTSAAQEPPLAWTMDDHETGDRSARSSPFANNRSNEHAEDTRPRPYPTCDLPTFQRILKWKFHDLKMILGSEVLLFSNKEHPAVSLKLHDMDQELSLCTVLDYYLDNVIANIPELAICMHSKGFVRGYKLVETRQIPYLSGATRPLFDVQEVSMNAAMLLKFLQENCSRPNGTYWLYRKEGENSLRLYDVNVLSQGKQLKWKYMMAMLCYRFASRASRLIHSVEHEAPRLQQQLQQRQRDLLRTCMTLLEEIAQAGGASHNSICSNVTEQLADTFLRECGAKGSSMDDRTEDPSTNVIESLQQAKKYLLDSIRAFEKCMDREPTDSSALVDEQDHQALDQGAEEDEENEMGSFMDEELQRLQLKYSSACLQLARELLQQSVSSEKLLDDAMGAVAESLQFLRVSDLPHDNKPLVKEWGSSCDNEELDQLLTQLDFDGIRQRRYTQGSDRPCFTTAEFRSSVLEMLGDMGSSAQRDATKAFSKLHPLYAVTSGETEKVEQRLLRLQADFNQFLNESTPAKTTDDQTALLQLSFCSYLRALFPRVDSELYFLIMKKLGNASNELGKHFLSVHRDYPEALRWFERGCKIFHEIEDGINVALLNANMAHLLKVLAQNADGQAKEKYYQDTVALCQSAIQQLKANKAESELHRTVKGELALSYLVWAVHKASIIKPQQHKAWEKDVLQLFNKAATLYSELQNDKQTASTHYQIASFYTRTTIAWSLEQSNTDQQTQRPHHVRSRMEIARRHYEKALHYFGKHEIGQTFVLIHQELADLYAFGGRMEDVEHALLLLLNTFEAFQQDSGPSMQSLAINVIAKLQTILHQLIRLVATSTSTKTTSKLATYKKMYKEVIYFNSNASFDAVVEVLASLRSMMVATHHHHSSA